MHKMESHLKIQQNNKNAIKAKLDEILDKILELMMESMTTEMRDKARNNRN